MQISQSIVDFFIKHSSKAERGRPKADWAKRHENIFIKFTAQHNTKLLCGYGESIGHSALLSEHLEISGHLPRFIKHRKASKCIRENKEKSRRLPADFMHHCYAIYSVELG